MIQLYLLIYGTLGLNVYDIKCTRDGSCNSPSTEPFVKSSDYVVCGKCYDSGHMRLHTANTHNKGNSRMRCNSQEVGSRTCNTTQVDSRQASRTDCGHYLYIKREDLRLL
jgi:hypothetical protein